MKKILKKILAALLIFSCINNLNPMLYVNATEGALESEGEKIEETNVSVFGDALEIEETKITDTEKYILNNIDERYAKKKRLMWADALTVKQTFAQKSKMPKDNLSLNGLWVSENEDEWCGDAFITMNNIAVVMYDTDEDSKYYVAYINPMVKDSGIETTDVVFAMNDNNANTYDDCIYDNNTGLAYIPKSHTLDIEGAVVKDNEVSRVTGALFMSQVQLLHLIRRDSEKTDINVSVTSDGFDEMDVEGKAEVGILDSATVVSLTDDEKTKSKIKVDDISVYINGQDVAYEDYGYDKESGNVVVQIAPSSVDSIKIEVNKDGIIESAINGVKSIFSSVVQAADQDFFGITWAKKSRVLPYTWTFDGSLDELKALRGDTLKINADDSDANKWSLYNEVRKAPSGAPNPETGEVYKYLANGYWYDTGIPYTKKNDEYSFSYGAVPSAANDNYDGWIDYFKKQENIANYIASASGAPSKSTLINNLASLGGKDSDLSNNYGQMWYGAEVPASFKLKDNSGNVTNWQSIPRSAANNSTLQNKNTKNLIFPLQCAHIESPLGQDNGTDAIHKLYFKLIDYNVDVITGEGVALVGIVGQTGVTKDENGQTVSAEQTPVGISMVFLETTVEKPQPAAVKKSSTSHEATDPLNTYTFDGITYRIYTDSDCSNEATDVDGNPAIITLNSDGTVKTPVVLKAGAYWIQELSANTRRTQYLETDEIKSFEIVNDGDDVIINFADPPVHDPIDIQKHDHDTNKDTPQGEADFTGILFKLDYWDVIMDANIRPQGEPKYSWIFESDENGYVDCTDPSYFLSGTINPILWNVVDDEGETMIDYPSGTYSLSEIRSSYGYLINDTPVIGRIYGENDQTIHNTFIKDVAGITEFKDRVIRGGVEVTLRDVEYANEVRSQGDATLKGSRFGIYNRSTNPVFVNGREHDPVDEVDDDVTPFLVITTDEYGYATTGDSVLPTGDYTIRQLSPPEGYLRTGQSKTADVDEVYERDFTIGGKDNDNEYLKAGEISDQGKIITLDDCLNPVIRGGVKVVKEDLEILFKNVLTGEDNINSAIANVLHEDAGLNDVEFTIWNISYKNPDPDGIPKSNLVNAYVDNTYIKSIDDEETYISEDKSPDYEYGREVLKRPAATENTTWKELLRDYYPGYICTVKTEWDEEENKYIAKTYGTPGECLPYGTYLIAETKTNPSGKYILSDRSVFTVEIREDGEIVDTFVHVNGGITNETDPTTTMSGGDLIINQVYEECENGRSIVSFERDGSLTSYNRVKRTDITIKKKAEDSSNTLQVAFLLTNNTTGESHVIVMNENGQFSSSIDTGGYVYSGDENDILYAEHTRRTNENDKLYFDTNPDGSINYDEVIYDISEPIDVSLFDTKAGVWFGLTEDDVVSEPNDALCALPWGTYTLQELRCTTNTDYKLSIETLNLKNYKANPEKENSISAKDDPLKTFPEIKKTVITKFENEDIPPREDILADLLEEEKYIYRLYVKVGDNDIKNPVITDFVEQLGPDIVGEIESIDVSNPKDYGLMPNILYTQTGAEDEWYEELEEDVRGVKIELDGILKRNEEVFVDICMKAKNSDEKLVADNLFTLNYTDIIYINNDKEPDEDEDYKNYIEEEGEEIESNKTRVILDKKIPPTVEKEIIKGEITDTRLSVLPNEAYTYRLKVHANQDIADLVFTDYVEQSGTDILGFIAGVDVSYASSVGFSPSVSYICKDEEGNESISNSPVNSTGVIVKLHGILKEDESIYVDILMGAPLLSESAIAKNVYTLEYSHILYEKEREPGDPIESNETEVDMEPGEFPAINKEVIKGEITATQMDLFNNDEYSYRLNIESKDGKIKDFEVIDFIETVKNKKLGKIVGVDLAGLINKGLVAHAVYTSKYEPTEGDWTEDVSDDCVGVKIMVKGELGPNENAYADVKMLAPSLPSRQKAYNEFTLNNYYVINSDNSINPGEELISNTTKVIIDKDPDYKEEELKDDDLYASSKEEDDNEATKVGKSIGKALGVSPKTGDSIALLLVLLAGMMLVFAGFKLATKKKL